MNKAPAASETYGIHLLKVAAIMLQVLAHSYLWSVQQGLLQISNVGTTFNLGSYVLLSTALFLPMTAGAVMRLLAKVENNRVVQVDWRGIWALAFGLMLLESIKQAIMYHGIGFFSWNVLHLIAITLPFMLWLASISIGLVWSVGLAILLATPAMHLLAAQLPQAISLPLTLFGLPFKAVVLVGITTLFFASAAQKAWRSRSLGPKHKPRVLGLLCGLWLICLAFLLQIRPQGIEHTELATLPLGMLVGSENGMHIWGFFPWAGSILLGFGIFDLLVRAKASARCLGILLLSGLTLLLLFFDRYIYEVTSSLSATAFFSGYHFNRLPEKMLMVMGLFLICVPLFIWLARRGLETPYIVVLSRYVLWLYIFQTTVLMLVPGWVHALLGNSIGNVATVIIASLLAFLAAIALPAVFRLLPLNLKLQLQKN